MTFADGKITVKDVTGTAADVDTSNGVIHIMDEALLPPSDLADIGDTAVATGKFGILAAALTKVELVGALKGDDPFTVLAPTDEAFAAALEALGVTAEELLARDDLADILKDQPAGRHRRCAMLRTRLLPGRWQPLVWLSFSQRRQSSWSQLSA